MGVDQRNSECMQGMQYSKVQPERGLKKRSHIMYTITGQRLLMHIMTIKKSGRKANKHWRILVYEATGLTITDVFSNKDKIMEFHATLDTDILVSNKV